MVFGSFYGSIVADWQCSRWRGGLNIDFLLDNNLEVRHDSEGEEEASVLAYVGIKRAE